MNITIVEQGRVLVNGTKATVYASAPNIVCAYIDLDSKNAELLHGARSNPDIRPELCLYAGDETWPYDESKDHDDPTAIGFHDYAGWHVFMADVFRYTVKVVLVKNGPEMNKEAAHGSD